MRTLLLTAALALPGLAYALPAEMAQEGLVYDAQGAPIQGAHSVRIRLYDGPAGGAPLFDEQHANVEFTDGYYAIAVGANQPLTAALMGRPRLFMGVSIDGGAELLPRHPLRKVPAAFQADVALDVTGDIHPASITVGNQLIVNSNGEWVGPAAGLRGPEGPVGPRGPEGPAGAAGGNGSPDTPAQVLAKLTTVDGDGSTLDADRFDGLDSADFAKTPAEVLGLLRQADGAGSGVDADRIDGLDSSQFVRTAQQVLDLLKTVDGANSGVDADRLDGFDSSQFVRGAAQVLAELITVDGSGSGLDADRLDGFDSSEFLRAGGNATVGDLTVGGTFTMNGTLQLARAANDPVACGAATAGQIYFSTSANQFMGCDGTAWAPLAGAGGGGVGGKQLVRVNGARTWSDGSVARSCKAYLDDPAFPPFAAGLDGLYTIDTGRARFDVYCDMTTDGGGWTMLGHYRHPGNTNAPAGIENRDYAYFMRARTSTSWGNDNYIADPDSPGPWTDWRALEGMGWPAEFAVVLDQGNWSSAWEHWGRKVIYRVKDREKMPNWGTKQDILADDNLLYKLNPRDGWTDLGPTSASGTYYWYPRAANDRYLTLLHVSNYRYLDSRGASNHHYSFYWGAGMGGNDTWHHGARILIRESGAPTAQQQTDVYLSADANGVRTWADGTLSATCKQYRNPPAGKAYLGDIGSGTYRLRTPEGDIEAYCDMESDGGGWTLVSYYRHPGNANANPDHENRDYAYFMKARDNVAIGPANYIGDPNSAGAWADWRLLSAVSFPLEMAVPLDRGLPYLGNWEGTSAKVIYRVKNRSIMPNYNTTQDLTTGDNLYYKLNPGDNWTDVGGNSASGTYYWYPRASNNRYLSLLHVSNYRYLDGRAPSNYHHSAYYGAGMGGNDSWHHSAHFFVRELN